MARLALIVVAVLAVAVSLGLWLGGERDTGAGRDTRAGRDTGAGHERPSQVDGRPASPVTDPPLVRIAVAGDTGTGDAEQRATARRIELEAGDHPFDALLLLGDLVYEEGDAALADDRVLEPFSAVTGAGARLLPVLGNHDYASGEQQQLLGALGRREPWYVEHLGPVRVVVLDSNRVDDEEQTRWLRGVMAHPQPADGWTVVAMHHPAYSAGHHGSDLAVREAWSAIFAEHDVPLVLAGHDHDYQRSRPQEGVTYVVSGAGAKLRPTGRESFTAVSSSTRHFLDLLIYEDELVARAIDQSGRLVDAFTIVRGDAPAAGLMMSTGVLAGRHRSGGR